MVRLSLFSCSTMEQVRMVVFAVVEANGERWVLMELSDLVRCDFHHDHDSYSISDCYL